MIRSSLEKWCSQSLAMRDSQQRHESSRLAKVTVVIPSYGRQQFLWRQMVYWGNDAAKIVIVDGSPRPLSGRAQEMLATLPHIQYLHLPDTLPARLNLATRHIRTPYAVLLGDDEFFLKIGLSRAIDKLERNPGFVACIGQSLGFYPSSDGTTVTYGTGYPHWRYEVTQDTIEERLLAAMTNYSAATCYAVIREPFWSKSYGTIQSWSSPYASEMQQAIATYIFGKFSTVDEVYWMRSFENWPIDSKTEADPKLMFSDWWLSAQFRHERDRFVDILAGDVVSSSAAEYSEARQMILNAVASYLEFCGRRQRSVSVSSAAAFRSRISQLLRSVVPEKQVIKLKAILKIKQQGDLGSLDELAAAHVMNSFQIGKEVASELSGIETLVSGFWRARLSEK